MTDSDGNANRAMSVDCVPKTGAAYQKTDAERRNDCAGFLPGRARISSPAMSRRGTKLVEPRPPKRAGAPGFLQSITAELRQAEHHSFGVVS